MTLASCSPPPPSQTTTINVEVPASTEDKTAKADAPGETEIADLRVSDDINSDKPAAKSANSEPTNRDAEDAVPARQAASKPARAKIGGLLDYYDRVPSESFAAFDGVNRRSLLKRKGAIVDYKRNFIEIPGSADERDGDLHKLQISLFPNGNEPWIGVSRIVWPRGDTPGAVKFYYGYSDDDGLREAAPGFFPYNLKKIDGAYESAWLPRKGLDVMINSAQDSELNGPIFRYSSKKWTNTPFVELNEAQYAEYEGG